MTLANILSAVVVLGLSLTAYTLYIREVLRSGVTPNLSSWIAWLVSCAATLWVYLGANTDRIYALSLVIAVASCACVLALAWRRGRFQSLPAYQKVCMAISCAVVLVKLFLPDVPVSVQVVLILLTNLSFVPAAATAWDGSARVPLLPWTLWTLDLVVATACAWVADGSFMGVAIPAFALVGHMVILAASVRGRSRQPVAIPA